MAKNTDLVGDHYRQISTYYIQIYIYIHIKILVLCVHTCVTEKWDVWGRDYTSDARPSYLLYFVLRTHKKQLKGKQLGSSNWRDAIWEQQMKWMQSGNSKWSGCNWGAVGSGHMRPVVTRDTTAAQGWCCVRAGGYARLTMKKVRPQHKLTYICSERRTYCLC